MKNNIVVVGIGGFVLGLAMGLAMPGLFSTGTSHVAAPPPASQPSYDDETYMREQFEHAIKEYSAIVEKDPQNMGAWQQLGELYYAAGQYQESVDSFQKVLDNDPKNIEVLTYLGNLNYDYQKFTEAISSYQKVLDQDPAITDVRVDMATAYRRSKQIDKALEELHRAIADNPKHPNARVNLGIVLRFDKEDYAGAVTAWMDFLRLFPDHSEVPRIKKMVEETKELLN